MDLNPPGTTSDVEREQVRARVAVKDRTTDPGHVPDLRRGQSGQGLAEGRGYGDLRRGPGFGDRLGRNLPENFGHVGQGDAGPEVPGVRRLFEGHLRKEFHRKHQQLDFCSYLYTQIKAKTGSNFLLGAGVMGLVELCEKSVPGSFELEAY